MSGGVFDLGTLVAFLSVDDSGLNKGAESGESRLRKFAGTSAKLLAAGGVAAAAGFSSALYKIGATMDDVTDTIRVGTGATGADLEGMVDIARQVGKEVPASFEDIGVTVADLNTRLGLTGDTLKAVTKQVSAYGVATGEALDVNAVSGALKVFSVGAEDTEATLDDLFRTSQSTGVSVNELASVLGANGATLAQYGLTAGQSAALVGSLDKAGIPASKTVATLSRAMTVFAKDGKAPEEGLKGTVAELERLVGAGQETKALNLAGEVFGTRGASTFLAAIKSGTLSVETLNAATAKGGDTIVGAAEDTYDFAEQWALFKNRVVDKVAPVAARVFAAVGEGMEYINDKGGPALREVKAAAAPAIATLAVFASTVADWLVPNLSDLRDVVMDDLVPAIGDLWAAYGDDVQTAVAGAATALGIAWAGISTALDVLVPLVSSLFGFMADHQSVIVPLVAAYATFRGILIAQAAATAIYTAAQVALGAATGAAATGFWALTAAMLANPIGIAIAAIAALVVGFVIAYKKSETFRAIVDGALKGVGAAFSWLWEKAKSIFGWLRDNWPLLLAILTGPFGLAVYVIAKNWDRIKGGATDAKDWVIDKFLALVGFVKSLPGRIGSAVSGMWDGIKESFRSAINWIVDAWNGLSFSIPGFDPPGPGPKFDGITIGTPNIDRFAKGGFIPAKPGGTLGLLAEAGQDEWAVPDPKLRKLIREESGGGRRGRGPVSFRITNWREGLGFLEDLVDGVNAADAATAGMVGRMG